MALNEIQMNQFSEGSTATGTRVDELELPVEISHGSRSKQVEADEKEMDLELNIQKGNVGAQGPSGGNSEADSELVHDPASESREEDQDDGAGRTHAAVGDPENTDHIVTVEESAERICRACGPDEETPAEPDNLSAEPDNLLVKLGCHCRGSLSRMHRKCILEWYGPRIFQENNYYCELCNGLLHGRIERIVFRALIGQDSGTDILIKASRIMAPIPHPHPRRNAAAEAPALEAWEDGNARPDFHQINIVEIARGPTHLPHPPIWDAAHIYRQGNRSYYRSNHGGYGMCVVFFIILVIIGLGVAGVGKL